MSVDPLGALADTITLGIYLIKLTDLVIGSSTRNTPAAVLWTNALSSIGTQIILARDELNSAEDEVKKLRVKRGPGAEEANHKRLEVGFDTLIQELATQLQASEDAFCISTKEFKDKMAPGWVLLETLKTQARKAVAPIESHYEELKRNRLRVHEARRAIMYAFLLHCHDSTGGHFPTLESLGNTRDQLAKMFLWPTPFCKRFGAEDVLASGLLQCNTTDINLGALRESIQEMGLRWVHSRDDAARSCRQRRPSTVEVLEECRGKMLVQLEGVFNTIIQNGYPIPTRKVEGIGFVPLTASEKEQAVITDGPLFTSEDYTIALRGLCTLTEWKSICLAADGGIVIALGGKMSAGKSSIINAMLGRSLLPIASKCS